MVHKAALAFPLLGLSLLASAGPLDRREAAPAAQSDMFDDMIADVMGEFDGVLGEVTQLVNEILDGSKSGIDDFKDEKPASCAGSKDKCCICEFAPEHVYNTAKLTATRVRCLC